MLIEHKRFLLPRMHAHFVKSCNEREEDTAGQQGWAALGGEGEFEKQKALQDTNASTSEVLLLVQALTAFLSALVKMLLNLKCVSIKRQEPKY